MGFSHAGLFVCDRSAVCATDDPSAHAARPMACALRLHAAPMTTPLSMLPPGTAIFICYAKFRQN